MRAVVLQGRWVWFLMACLFVMGCGGESDDTDSDGVGGEGDASVSVVWPLVSASPVTNQTHLAEESIDGIEGCLTEARDALSGLGYPTFLAGGITSGDAVEVVWVAQGVGLTGGHLPGVSSGEGVALQICEGGVCRCVFGSPGPAGMELEALEGDDISLPVVGAPVLAKTLQLGGGEGSSALAEVTGALVEEASSPLDANLFLGKRRLIIANAYGSVFDIDFGALVSIMEASGLFTEVVEESYVTAAEMDGYLSELHNQDVLIWFGAAVRRSKGVGKFKPEGMTVNRGLYGDETYLYDRIEAQLRGAPLGGPGLVVLLGGESFGTTQEGMAPYLTTENLINGLTVRPRTVIGIEGMVSAFDALTGLRDFMETLVEQTDYSTAVTSWNALLNDANIRSNLDEGRLSALHLGPALSGFWGDATPSTGEFVGELLIGAATQCTPGAGGAVFNPIEKSVEFFVDLEVEGPFFWGAKAFDGTDFSVFGLIGSLQQGGELRFWVKGSHGGLNDVVVLGDGVFCSTGGCAGSVTGANDFKPGGKLFFGGSAEATTYQTDEGDVCKPSALLLTQKGGKPGWLIIDP